jgi:hypothetical protein
MMVCFETGRARFRTKGAKPHLKRTLRPCVSLSDNFLVQLGDYEGFPLVALSNLKGIEQKTLIIAC